MSKIKQKEDWEKEEWGGWKIVADMLDHPDENGIYPTSKCYKELYDFVVAQKQEQKQETKKAKIKWDKVKDELYTYFGECSNCGNTEVIFGSKYCDQCGRKIVNPE